MRFLLGLVIGALSGGGAVYLALETPWVAVVADDSEDAGAQTGAAADSETVDKGSGKRKKRRRHRAATSSDPGQPPVLSPRDRKPVWKGDAVKLPQRTVDFAGAGAADGRPLSGVEINQTIRDQSAAVLGCIKEARGEAPLKSTISVKLLVGPDGRVSKMRVRAPNYLFDHGFYPCAHRAARAMTFPATGAHTVVDVPFELR